MEGPFS